MKNAQTAQTLIYCENTMEYTAIDSELVVKFCTILVIPAS